MYQILSKKINSKVFCFIFFIALAFCPLFLKNKIIIGTIVNAVLFLSVYFLGLRFAILIGFLPSLILLFAKVISPSLVIFIIISNSILSCAFYLFKKHQSEKGFFVAPFLKCAFLYMTLIFLKDNSFFIKQIFLFINVHQIITAYLGSFLALSVIKVYQSKKFKKVK